VTCSAVQQPNVAAAPKYFGQADRDAEFVCLPVKR